MFIFVRVNYLTNTHYECIITYRNERNEFQTNKTILRGIKMKDELMNMLKELIQAYNNAAEQMDFDYVRKIDTNKYFVGYKAATKKINFEIKRNT